MGLALQLDIGRIFPISPPLPNPEVHSRSILLKFDFAYILKDMNRENQTDYQYYISLVLRKLTGVFYTYPEFAFLGRILAIFVLVGVVFVILKGVFGQ